jgi:hypothetical protein
MSKELDRKLAKLPFSEKLKLLAKLRDRSLAMAAARRKQLEAQRKGKHSPFTPGNS